MIDLSNVRLQLATISSPRNEPKVSTFWRGGGKRRLEVVEVAEEGVGVERGGREAAVGGGGGGCWEDTWDVGGTPPTPWGEAVEARCRGDDNPPATTKNTREPVSTISRVHDIQPNFDSRDVGPVLIASLSALSLSKCKIDR